MSFVDLMQASRRVIRLFESDLLERLTRVHPLAPVRGVTSPLWDYVFGTTGLRGASAGLPVAR